LATSHKGILSRVLITFSSKKGNLAFGEKKEELDAYQMILAIPLSRYQQYIYHLFLDFSSKFSACPVSFPHVAQAN
jgi:hypothetical protein